jgi:hypothetical protein
MYWASFNTVVKHVSSKNNRIVIRSHIFSTAIVNNNNINDN